MKSIADVIASHPVPGIREAAIRELCAEALAELLGVAVPARKIRFEAGVLSLSLPPVVKTSVLLKEEDLRSMLSVRGLTLTEIR